MLELLPNELASNSRHRLLVVELPEGRRRLIERHLLQLAPEDRRLRFGRPMHDFALLRYARGIDFAADTVFGAFDHALEPIGIAHIGIGPGRAELGLSVLASARRRGVAHALLVRSLVHARARGVAAFEMAFLPDNAALRALAVRNGMTLTRGSEEPHATLVLASPVRGANFREALDAALGNADLGFRLAAARVATPGPTSA